MADINKEIQDFKNAVYGEEVRGSMISLAQKLNQEIEGNTTDAAAAAKNANNAASTATRAAGEAGNAAQTATKAAGSANTAAENAEAIREDLLGRLERGEFNGSPGPQGEDRKSVV